MHHHHHPIVPKIRYALLGVLLLSCLVVLGGLLVIAYALGDKTVMSPSAVPSATGGHPGCNEKDKYTMRKEMYETCFDIKTGQFLGS